ncbi:putative centromere protein F-like [Scophthalmus maximus]|uniref:Putative centromere protein F-like n=1 Tax=Scophthalmus maximus TaxID=52904 RepID=A0A2U9C5V3_SCOMX|nr:putative centromere protein F-like [Scophthalmus maximus]
MSWAEEDWTVGLSGRVLQKVKELQIHQERLSRESKQKQLQLDKVQTSLEKQTVKYEEVRGELQSVQRELQSVRDEAKAAVISRERLVQELQTKQAQVCSFEGQLDSARSLNNKLTQEVKRSEPMEIFRDNELLCLRAERRRRSLGIEMKHRAQHFTSGQMPSTDVISRGQPAPGLYGKEMELRTETDSECGRHMVSKNMVPEPGGHNSKGLNTDGLPF